MGIVLIGLVLIAGFTRVSLGESLGLIQDALIEDKEVSLGRIVVTPMRYPQEMVIQPLVLHTTQEEIENSNANTTVDLLVKFRLVVRDWFIMVLKSR